MPHLSYSGTELRKHDNDRYLCTLFAPAAIRESLFALFAFNSEIARIRETVSESMLGLIRLQWWREAISSIYSGNPRKHEVVTALASAIHTHQLPEVLFYTLIDAREADLDDAPPATMSELILYAEKTGGVLLELATMITGNHSEQSLKAAHHLGTAYALIGQLRALPFRLGRYRIMLPADHLPIEEIKNGKSLETIPPVILEIAGIARQHLTEVDKLRADIPNSALSVFLHYPLASAFLGRIKKFHGDLLTHSIEEPRLPIQLRLFVNGLFSRF